jgi:hypothetical protein
VEAWSRWAPAARLRLQKLIKLVLDIVLNVVSNHGLLHVIIELLATLGMLGLLLKEVPRILEHLQHFILEVPEQKRPMHGTSHVGHHLHLKHVLKVCVVHPVLSHLVQKALVLHLL